MISIEIIHPRARPDMAGYIPLWLNETNPKSAREQLNDGYRFGGWQPFEGFTLNKDNSLSYPGDPPQPVLLQMRLREELVCIYPSSWVAVIQPDRSFEVCRMD